MGLKTGRGAARRMLAIAAIMAVAGTAACGDGDGAGGADESAAPKNVTLRFNWWGNQDRADVTEKAIDLFESKHTTIKVETSFAEFGAYFQKLATEIAGGGGPDVVQMDYRYIREYSDRGVLAEFNKNGANVKTGDINPTLLSSGKINGKLFALPVGQNTQIVSYDPVMVKAAGGTEPTDKWTWNDLKTLAQKISDHNKNASRGMVDPGGIEDWFEVYIRQQGKSLYNDDGKLGYTAADVAKWWEFTDGMRKSNASTQPEVTSKMDGSQANDPVYKKQAHMGMGYDSGLTAKSWELLGREMKIHNFPSDTDKLGQYAKPSMQLCISKRSENPKEAAMLIDFLLNDPEAGKILGMSRGLPVNAKIRESVGGALTGPPAVGYQFEQKIASRLTDAPPPPPKGAGTVKTTFQRVYDDVIFGRSTPQAAADKFMNEAKQALGA